MHTKLLRSQRNELFIVTKESGLDPTDFAWSEVKTRWHENGQEPVEALTHKPTGYQFVFDRYKGKANPRFTPSSSQVKEVDPGEQGSWQEVFTLFREWLVAVRSEYLEPDLWEQTKTDSRLVAPSLDEVGNEPFSEEEKKRISASIHELLQFVTKTATHTPAQLEFVATRLQHLEEASHRLGRKDWITLAMGTLTNIVVGVALSPDAAKELLRTAGSLLGWIVGNFPLLP